IPGLRGGRQEPRQAAQGGGILGVEADGLVVVLDGPVVLSPGGPDVAPTSVGRRVVRVESDGFTEVVNRLGVLLEDTASDPAPGVRPGRGGITGRGDSQGL